MLGVRISIFVVKAFMMNGTWRERRFGFWRLEIISISGHSYSHEINGSIEGKW